MPPSGKFWPTPAATTLLEERAQLAILRELLREGRNSGCGGASSVGSTAGGKQRIDDEEDDNIAARAVEADHDGDGAMGAVAAA